MSKYWAERVAASQNKVADKTIGDIEKQLKKYYSSAMKRTIDDFEATYNKLLATMEDGKEPTPADLYKLDRYWQMQGQLKQEMQKLGDKEIKLLSSRFEKEWREIYNSFALSSDKAFNIPSSANAKAMINSTWLADGKNFSQRIWDNTEKLVETLNDNLIHCVVTGKKPTELKRILQERFNVSYSQADALVRTEAAHVQTMAAQQRYKDSGVTMVEVLADEDERRCDVCGKLHETKHPIDGPMPVPAHPRCRCCIVPVIDDESEKVIMEEKKWYELNEKEKEQLERVYAEYPEAKIQRDERVKKNEERKVFWLQALNEIDKILNGEMGIESFVLATNFKVNRYNRKTHRYEYMIKENWKEQLLRYKEDYEKRLDSINAEDYFTWSDFVYCEDCGKPIPREGKATNAIKRCPECQTIYRKKYKAIKEKERRAKKKLNK
jgi:SPP1 gp7 family putative phage head morphogenesis protein